MTPFDSPKRAVFPGTPSSPCGQAGSSLYLAAHAAVSAVVTRDKPPPWRPPQTGRDSRIPGWRHLADTGTNGAVGPGGELEVLTRLWLHLQMDPTMENGQTENVPSDIKINVF